MVKRNWKALKELTGSADTAVEIVIETLDFATLLISVEAIGAAVSALSVSPPEVGDKGSIPTNPPIAAGVLPAAGTVAFFALNYNSPNPMPPSLMVKASPAAGGSVRIKVEGDLLFSDLKGVSLDTARS